MKRRLAVTVIMFLLIFTGCAGGGEAVPPGFSRDDLQLIVSGKSYTVNMDIEEVIADLGTGYRYSEAMSCDYDGLDKTFEYDDAVFYTNPLSEGDLVNEIYTESSAVSTSKGIAVGASKEDILAAYGEDCEDEGDLLIYRVDGDRAALCFEIENGEVWAIYLTTQSV